MIAVATAIVSAVIAVAVMDDNLIAVEAARAAEGVATGKAGGRAVDVKRATKVRSAHRPRGTEMRVAESCVAEM